MRFCYAADSGSDVWSLPSEMALANCDFSEATLVCAADEGADDDCCNYVVEEDATIGPRFFASKQGCEQGQRAAVNIADYDETVCLLAATTPLSSTAFHRHRIIFRR